MKICEDIYSYIWQDYKVNNCNSFYIDGDYPILIDPGLSNFTENIISQMKEDNLAPEKIKIIILTHSHPDHIHGIADFPDCLITLSREENKFLQNEGRQLYSLFGINIPDFKAEFFLQDGEFKAGKKLLKIFLTPGHSPGSICIYFPNRKALFTGDLIFQEGVGRVDFPGGDIELLRNSIDEISKLDIEYLLPGHGDIIVGKKNILENFAIVKEIIGE